MILFVLIAYMVIASASVFGLIVAAGKADMLCHSPEFCDVFGYVFSGILWPLCLLPCMAYIAAKWYIKNHEGE